MALESVPPRKQEKSRRAASDGITSVAAIQNLKWDSHKHGNKMHDNDICLYGYVLRKKRIRNEAKLFSSTVWVCSFHKRIRYTHVREVVSINIL